MAKKLTFKKLKDFLDEYDTIIISRQEDDDFLGRDDKFYIKDAETNDTLFEFYKDNLSSDIIDVGVEGDTYRHEIANYVYNNSLNIIDNILSFCHKEVRDDDISTYETGRLIISRLASKTFEELLKTKFEELPKEERDTFLKNADEILHIFENNSEKKN